MACGPCAARAKNRTQYEVVSADGKRLFGPTASKPTAEAVSKRYAGSTVQEKPKPEAKQAPA